MFLRFSSFVKGFLQKINNMVFYRTFIIIIIFVTIPVISISLLSIRHSTDNIMRQVKEASMNNLSDKKSIIDQRIREIDTLVSQVMINSDLQRLNSSVVFSYSEQILMSNVISTLEKLKVSNNLIHSIYIHDDKKDYILSDAKYRRSNFDDMEIIDLGFQDVLQVVRRQIGNVDVITYIRRFDDIIRKSTQIIAVNIDYNVLFNVYAESPPYAFDTFIFSDDCSEILLMSSYLDNIGSEMMKSILNHSDNTGLFNINGDEYFICKVRSDILDWNIAYVQPYYSIIREAQLLRNLIVYSLIIILLLSFVLAYIISMYLYKPLALLASKAEKHLDLNTGKVTNAYEFIDDAMIKLFNKNSELMSRYQMALPYFKKHSIDEILSGKVSDTSKMTNILNLLGIHFCYSKYINIIIDFENREFKDELKDLIDSHISRYNDSIAYIISPINKFRISLILNTDIAEEGIHLIFKELKSALNSKNIELTIAIGEFYESINNAYLFHRKALVQMENKFFTGKNQILLSTDNYNVSREFVYDKKLQEELISCFVSQDNEGATHALRTLIGKIVDNNGSIEYIKYVYFQVIFNVILSLEHIGITSVKIDISRTEIFDSILKFDTFEDLQRFSEDTITKCILLIDEYRQMQDEVIIEKTVEYLKSNYSEDISLDEVSRNVFLSPRYLNNMFKASTGCTIYEYITKLRMETAQHLLLKSDSKIQDIAMEVGYNSIQSFLRLFKKYYCMTPIEYRRRFG